MSYENPWRFNGEIFESSDIQDYFGFVYHIHCTTTGRSYIGRKYFWSFTKPKGKSRKVKSESNWKVYYGSCPELKADLNIWGKTSCNRTILSLHKTKGQCNYEETKQLFLNNVLIESLDDGTPAYYNSNILGRYMRKDYGNFGKDSQTIT
jgi:Putative endonuclease segE, GIY-YIG domain